MVYFAVEMSTSDPQVATEPARPMALANGWLPWIAFALGASAIVIHNAFLQPWVMDDSYIYYRYAENWAAGNGVVFNAGERVEGYTTILWVALLALGAAMRLDVPAGEAEQNLRQWIQGTPKPEQMERFLAADSGQVDPGSPSSAAPAQPQRPAEPERIDEAAGRRWYPVIDFSRCTNCMECIDFCLFGVCGVDTADTILVAQPDDCRKGCPACSRVCPENAIIFPQHKTPAIAGAAGETTGLKIDLSALFGAPDAAQLAARERDEQLVLAGRAPVGDAELEKRQADKNDQQPKDELDALIEELDESDL